MDLVTDRSRYILPEVYFAVVHSHVKDLKLESATVSAQIEPWSRADTFVRVAKFMPEENKVKLTNGKEYTYKALVVSTGFEHKSEFIEGLPDFEKDRGENNVFVHAIDNKLRVDRNFYSGWNHTNGDMIVYSPKFPYKGEGCDFYALYYEHFLRQDQLQGRAAKNARIQFWTPNKEIFKYPYANEVALDECHKRGVDVNFGWELVKVHQNEFGEKIATFRNVDSGDTIEKDFFSAVINPTSKPQQELVDAGLTNDQGLVDVNPYTLQHRKYENIFAFGDCIAGNTTRTQAAATAQNPVVKHNLLNYMNGKELNAVYDGYTFMPLFLGHSYATSFSHLYDYEPTGRNHMIPHYGIFSRIYFGRMLKSMQSSAEKYSSFKKNQGPPYYHFNRRYMPLEHNDYLQRKGINPNDLRMFEPKTRVDDHHHGHH